MVPPLCPHAVDFMWIFCLLSVFRALLLHAFGVCVFAIHRHVLALASLSFFFSQPREVVSLVFYPSLTRSSASDFTLLAVRWAWVFWSWSHSSSSGVKCSHLGQYSSVSGKSAHWSQSGLQHTSSIRCLHSPLPSMNCSHSPSMFFCRYLLIPAP